MLVAVVILAGCGNGGRQAAATSTTRQDPPSPTTTSGPPDPVVAELCAVLDTARAGDVEEVRATFDHGPLHTLAEEVIELDRAVAATLLVAKEAVESDLAAPDTPPADITADLEALTSAAADAIATRDDTPPTGCEVEDP